MESSHLEGTLNKDCFGFRKPVCWLLESQRNCNMSNVCTLERTSSQMKTARQKHELTRCSGSPSCPSHTKAATSSPLSGCWPSLVIQLNPRRSHTHLRRSLRAGLMGRTSASQESQDPQRCRAVRVASAHVVIPRQSHPRLRRSLRTRLMGARRHPKNPKIPSDAAQYARHRCSCTRQIIPRRQIEI